MIASTMWCSAIAFSPCVARQFPLYSCIESAVLRTDAQPVPEHAAAIYLWTPFREDVQIHRRITPTQQPVLKPIGLAVNKHITGVNALKEEASSDESRTVMCMSITGLASRFGTAVDPTCSMSMTPSPSAARIFAASLKTACTNAGRVERAGQLVELVFHRQHRIRLTWIGRFLMADWQ